MSAIHGKNTKPELYIRKLLFALGYRYRVNSSSIKGHPDIWMKKYNTAIFIHGCFWHRHENCKYSYMPKSRIDFWEEKFKKNMARDITVCQELNIKGVKCLIIWECTIRKMKRDPDYSKYVISQIEQFLNFKDLYLEL